MPSTLHLTTKSKVGNTQNLTPLRSMCLLEGEWYSINDLDGRISAHMFSGHLLPPPESATDFLNSMVSTLNSAAVTSGLANCKDLLGWIPYLHLQAILWASPSCSEPPKTSLCVVHQLGSPAICLWLFGQWISLARATMMGMWRDWSIYFPCFPLLPSRVTLALAAFLYLSPQLLSSSPLL